ncbi:T9SS type A sorting domain-containing protein [bacterium]|nr:T9SS type A sorting domain-containing protein [bacterium]
MNQLLLKTAFVLCFFSENLLATPYWSLEQINEFHAKKEKSENQLAQLPIPYSYKNNSYPVRIAEIAHYLSVWQVKDSSDPEFGGMVEAESGDLSDVVQTDNTLESIWVWCAYGELTGDTTTYKQNILDAWIYAQNFPAYNEEGSGSDYYRNHNCAWALVAETAYRNLYNSATYSNYAQTCANYISNHPMNFSQSGYTNIHPFVAGWCAGNLYLYGVDTNNQNYKNTAVTWGNNVKTWLEANVANFSREDWAMSSGTAVWGLCNSTFKENPTLGQTWIAQNSANFEVFVPYTNISGYDWDASWNVAYANSHAALFDVSGDSSFYRNHLALTDTLISFDKDKDGAIPAETAVINNEDMTWVSCYLALMGAGNTLANLPQHDVGFREIVLPKKNQTFAVGQPIPLKVRLENFGLEVPTSLILINANVTGTSLNSGLNSFVNVCGSVVLELGTFTINQAGTYELVFSLQSQGDSDFRNDTLKVEINVVQGVQLAGQISGLQTGFAKIKLVSQSSEYETQTDFSGNYQLNIPAGTYDWIVEPPLPFGMQRAENLNVNANTTQNFTLLVAELMLVDDDGGDFYEREFFEPLFNLNIPFAYRENKKQLWTQSETQLLAKPRIVYFTGDQKTDVLNQNEEALLETFLQSGGQLLITGKNIAESEHNSQFFQDYFKLNWNENSTAATGFAFGVSLVPQFASLNFYTSAAGFTIDNQDADMDKLTISGTVNDQPVQAFNYDYLSTNPSTIGGTVYHGNYDVVFLGFGIEGIAYNSSLPLASSKEQFFTAINQWFDLVLEVGDETNTPQTFKLYQNFPNPFNPTTKISYEFESYEKAKLIIFNVLGQKIKEFELKNPKGEVVWNGTDFSGNLVASGIYFYQLKVENFSQTKKMLFLK